MKRCVLLAAIMAVLIPGRAHAIPAFARQFGAKCSMCHWPLPPRLNNVGLTFRRMGFRLPDTQDDKFILKPLPSQTPFDATSLLLDLRAHDSNSASEFQLNEADLISAGNLGAHASYFAGIVYDGEKFSVEKAEAQVYAGTPERAFIGRFGRIEPLLWEKGNEQRLSISTPLIYDTAIPAGSFPGFGLGDAWVGLEVGGALNHLGETGELTSTYGAVSVFNGVNGETGEVLATGSNHRGKDVAVQLVHNWGESNTLGLMWYHGLATGTNPGPPPADFLDRFDRFVVSGNVRVMGVGDLLAAYMRGRDRSSEVGSVDSKGFFIEGAAKIGTKLAPYLRYDDLDAGAAGGIARGWTVGAEYQAQNNILLRLEYERLAPGDLRDITFQTFIAY